MPNLPIFSQSSSIKEKSITPSTPANLMPFFFAMPPQMASFAQNLNMNNSLGSPLASSKQPIPPPSLDEFFTKLDEPSGGTEEFARFKNIFENERITVDQIYDLTDVEFDQLGINKIGWRKAFRAAAQRYK